VKIQRMHLLSPLLLAAASLCPAQAATTPENPATAVSEAFKTHDIVTFGEIHRDKQEYEWLDSLVADPEFASHVDDIVVETGNSCGILSSLTNILG
jgi:hypothetical protein